MWLGALQKKPKVINKILFQFYSLVKIDKDDKLYTPDPTKYEVKLKSGSPKWTISGRIRKSNFKKPTTPGSGRYEYKTFIGEGPKYSFGNFHTEENNKEKEYETKKIRYKKFEVPGPGFYTIEDKNRGPKYSMYARNHDSTKNLRKIKTAKSEVPGVGKYEIRKEIDYDTQSFRFGQSLRTDLVLNETALKNPEPGKYDVDYNKICTTTPSYSFSQLPRFPYLKTVKSKEKQLPRPGPWAYNPKEYFGKEGPFFTFSKLPDAHKVLDPDEIKKSKENPSVGKYIKDIQYTSDSPKYSFPEKGKEQKSTDKGQKGTPGPIYNPNKDISSTIPNSPKWTWGLKINPDDNSKKNNFRKKETPGPGEYNYKGDNIPQGPKYSMRTLLKKIKVIDFPGPGHYDTVKEEKSNWGYTIGKETRDEDIRKIKKEDFPGPGKYVVKDVDLVKCFTFSKSKKEFVNKKDSFPGPGSYKIPSSFNYINNMTREKGAYNPRFKYI